MAWPPLLDGGQKCRVPQVPFQLPHAIAPLCNRTVGETTSTLATSALVQFGHVALKHSKLGPNPPADILALTTAQALWEVFPPSTRAPLPPSVQSAISEYTTAKRMAAAIRLSHERGGAAKEGSGGGAPKPVGKGGGRRDNEVQRISIRRGGGPLSSAFTPQVTSTPATPQNRV